MQLAVKSAPDCVFGMTLPSHTDVLVVGGGPVGLLITYILLLGGHKVITLGRLRANIIHAQC
jgi:NADPH-dependent 2,4-dienoyl-CoA reductase/sulfur reductase-like enzyme